MPIEELKGWVRSRRRGNYKLLFVDIDPVPLLESDTNPEDLEELDPLPVNETHTPYYKYKNTFSISPTTRTLIIYSDDGKFPVGVSENEPITCDQIRKSLTVGSEIHCLVSLEQIHQYSDNDLPVWFRNNNANITTPLFRVMKIYSILSSRTVMQVPSAVLTLSVESTNMPPMDADKSLTDDSNVHADRKHKRQRTNLFVDWLIETYSSEYLNSGSGVIDIAGGKGAISWELHCIRSVKCSLVDPRTVPFGWKAKKISAQVIENPIRAFSSSSYQSRE